MFIRKSYDKFHSDIFPDTPGPVASMGPTQWMGGDNEPPAQVILASHWSILLILASYWSD